MDIHSQQGSLLGKWVTLEAVEESQSTCTNIRFEGYGEASKQQKGDLFLWKSSKCISALSKNPAFQLEHNSMLH